MQEVVEFGNLRIKVNVTFLERKRLSITVHPNKKVTAKAPKEYEPKKVSRHIQKRKLWIVRQIEYFDRFHPQQPPRKYVSGETHYYLGRQYRLKIRKSIKNQVKLIGRYFYVYVPDPANRLSVKKVVQEWYSLHAKNILERHVLVHWPDFERIGAKSLQIHYRRMHKRWGSCSKNGIIVLNTELVKTPVNCINYVIIHELCHIIYPNHDKKFYKLLQHFDPDWKKHKEKLEQIIL